MASLSFLNKGGAFQIENIVKFIEKEYDIPNDLEYYIELFSFFDKMRNALMSSLVKKIKARQNAGDAPGIENEEMLPQFNEQINRVIKKLCDKGIYNKTVDDFIKNAGYDLYKNINDQATSQLLKMVRDANYAWETGKIFAEYSASSNITGSGVGVWSSSFTTLAVASALEMSTLKRQAEKADKQYVSEVKSLGNSVMATLNKNANDYLNKEYFPNMETAMSVFSFNVMDNFLEELIKIGAFNEVTMQFVDFKKSHDLLKNLSLSSNKQAVLEAAFLACPFNDAVYEKAAEFGLCDTETLKTAKKYCPGNKAAQSIVDNCKIKDKHCNYKAEYDRILPHLPIVALQLDKSESIVIKYLFQTPFSYYKETFQNYNNIISLYDKAKVKNFVLNVFAKGEVFSKTPEQIYQSVSTVINREINIDNYTFLCSLGYDFSDLVSDSTSQTLVDYFIDNISKSVVTYIGESKAGLDKIIALQNDYSKALKEKDNAISALEQELVSLGLFAISKKRDVKQRIETAKTDRDKFVKQSPIDKQFNNFQEKYIG